VVFHPIEQKRDDGEMNKSSHAAPIWLVSVIADAGPRHGLGHLSRSGALAVALRCRGMSIRCYAHGLADPIERDGITWTPLAHSESVLQDSDVVVLDSYKLDPDALALQVETPLVLLHDRGGIPDRAALVVAPASHEDHSKLLAGFKYAPLRPMFWGLPSARIRPDVQRLLVATGGGDVRKDSQHLAIDARAGFPDAQVSVVVGPYARRSARDGMEMLGAPSDLLSHFVRADIVVTAAGQTLLEAAATGVPTIAVITADNQRKQAEKLRARGAVVVAEPGPELVRALRLLTAREERVRLAVEAQATIDGYGALRVAFQIERLLAQRPRKSR
jgi:UDP-2,4-diacetamido-2,4,6-trideoxy-beta-L-altropyranose hydrolase